MIRINLLPLEKRPPRWNYGRLVALPMVLLIVMLVGLYAFGEYRIWDMERRIEETRIRQETLSRAEEQMRQAMRKQSLIGSRQQVLTQLSKSRQSWHGTMAHVGTLMSRTVWLTDVSTTQRGIVQVKGNAMRYSDLVLFFSKLENDKFFTEPTLLRAEQADKAIFTKFEITFKVQEPK